MFPILSLLKNKCIPGLLLGLGFMALNVRSYGQRVYADEEQHGIQTLLGTGLFAEITNPMYAKDSNINNSSTLHVDISILGALLGAGKAWQDLQFTGTDKPSSTSPVTLKFEGDQTFVGISNGFSISRTYNNTAVSPNYSGSTFLDLLGLLGNGTIAQVTVPPTGIAFNGVKLEVNSQLLGLGLTANYYYAFFIVEPLIENDTICSGETATLTIPNFQSDTAWEYRWYNTDNAATDTTAVGATTSPSINITPALNTGTSPVDTLLYVEAVQTVGGQSYKSARRTVTIWVNPIPAAPTMDDLTLCSGVSATIPITNHNAAFQYDVYDAATLGTLLVPNTGGSFIRSGINNPPGSAQIVSNYFVSAKDNSTSCISSRTKVTITTDAQTPEPAVTIE